MIGNALTYYQITQKLDKPLPTAQIIRRAGVSVDKLPFEKTITIPPIGHG